MKEIVKIEDRIDLWDETLREGSERAPTSSTIEEKVEIAVELSKIGIKTIVVGMFPEVPASYSLLDSLLSAQSEGHIAADVRFIVISHVGKTAERTKQELAELNRPLSSVWLMLIHSVSDQQIANMFPTIARSYSGNDIDLTDWETVDIERKRQLNLAWFDQFLGGFEPNKGIGGVAVGLLDYFRADIGHVKQVIGLVQSNDIGQIRLVDTAGTCVPEQIGAYVENVISGFPGVKFFGHFHNDFGLATANSVMGLRAGLKGVDVSVGGFANRAGHPPLAEVVMTLRDLYGMTIQGFKYQNLVALSRFVEQKYCLIESPTQPITGVITHSVTSGIRTQLVKKCPTIFDVIKPEDVGANLQQTYGIRSGVDGVRRLISMYRLDPKGILGEEEVVSIYKKINSSWEERSVKGKFRLKSLINEINTQIVEVSITEAEVIGFIKDSIKVKESTDEFL